MNNKSFINRVIRKGEKILQLNKRNQDSEMQRKMKSLAMGRKFHLEKNGYIFECSTLKPKFYLPLYKTDYIQQCILTEGNYYESLNLDYICKKWNNGKIGQTLKDGCILDIGANIGNHTLYYFFECGIKEAICFEPINSTYNILKRNVEINNIAKFTTLIKSAVGAFNGTGTVAHYDLNNIGSTQISIDETGTIPIVSVDSMDISSNIILVKIDVEGFERNVIEGCIETLKKHKPYIMIEIQSENFEYISNELSKIGYHYLQLTGINYLFYII